MDHVNVTRIMFDDKLKAFIKEIKATMGSEIDFLSELVSASLDIPHDEGQRFFRNYFKENKDALNYINDKPVMAKPDIFALFTCLMIDISKLTIWEDVFKEAFIDDVSGQRLEYEDESRTFNYTCVCGQHIMEICRLNSPDSRRSVVVGNCCVRKNLICNPQAQEYIKDAAKRKRKTLADQKKRALKQLEYNTCMDCKTFNIKKTEPHWMTRCYPCWKIRQEELNKKR